MIKTLPCVSQIEHDIVASAVRYALICKQIATVFLLSLASSQSVNTPLSLYNDFAAKFRKIYANSQN